MSILKKMWGIGIKLENIKYKRFGNTKSFFYFYKINNSNMDKNELKQRLKTLKDEHDEKVNQLYLEYAKSNRKYNIGDKVTDHIGSIIVEKFRVTINIEGLPENVYIGPELKKDGTPKKNGDVRPIYESNIRE